MSNAAKYYQNIVPVDRNLHTNWSVRPLADAGFCRGDHVVMLLASEFVEACREYPIVFLRNTTGIVPVAVLGLGESQNLFVNGQGQWEARYVPAYVRRYPFAFAETADGQLLLSLDGDYAGLDKAGKTGQRLFDQSGLETDFLKNMLDFVQRFQDDAMRTGLLCAELDQLGLFKSGNLNNGGQVSLGGFLMVDEQKMAQLGEAEIASLFRSGALGAIYAHLISLGNVNSLAQRLAARTGH